MAHQAEGEIGLVAMWGGDAGYESGDADVPGARHRLLMKSGGFEFDDSGSAEFRF